MAVVGVEERRDALVAQLFQGAIGFMDLVAVYIGDRLGLYEALARLGPSTSRSLAAEAGLEERYVREWLEQQAVSGILEVDDPAVSAGERRYLLPAGHEEVLLDSASLNCFAPLARISVTAVGPLDSVIAAFRSGAGVPYEAYGADFHEAVEAFTRPFYDSLLAQEWLPSLASMHERLLGDPPARVADLACGRGRSTIAIARGYPKVQVDGIDLDEPSIAAALDTLAGSGLEERVSFRCCDAAEPELAGRYDLVTIFEALHDMARPVEALRAARALLALGGCVFVGDEKSAETFTLPADDYERLNYGFSVLHCLPVGMIGEQPAGTGTIMRPATVQRYAKEAGFAEFEVLSIENDYWRFYRMAG